MDTIDYTIPFMWALLGVCAVLPIIKKCNSLVRVKKGPDNSLRQKNCSRNPEHKEFHTFKDFNYKLLPYPFNEDKEMETIVKAIGELVVKIELKVEEKKFKFGTGKVVFSEKKKGTLSDCCPCNACQEEKKRSEEKRLKEKDQMQKTEWGEIHIFTAWHNFRNKEEVKRATCLLNYDDEEESNLITLNGFKIVWNSVDRDTCKFFCISHDMDLVKSLRKKIYDFKDLHEKIYEAYQNTENRNLTIIVSHPHGLAKHVTFGYHFEPKTMDDEDLNLEYTTLFYDAPTCDGSSGAPVYRVDLESAWYLHPHSTFYKRDRYVDETNEWVEESCGVSGAVYEKSFKMSSYDEQSNK